MTIWQSLALISAWQAAYAVGLVALFWVRGSSLIAGILLADFIALLAIAAAMDFAILDKADARWFMLVVWIGTAAFLITQPGAGRVMGAISAITAMIFLICLRFDVQIATTSAIVNAIALIQLAVAGIGSGGDDHGNRGRHSDVGHSLSISVRSSGLGAGGMAQTAALLSQDRRGQ